MLLVPSLSRTIRPFALAALAVATAVTFPGVPAAHGVTLATPFAIGLKHAQAAPYNFTGRVFDLDFIAFGSGTLLRRHTVLTAGHVVYDPVDGFTANTTFTRALYENYRLSVNQVISVAALSGYQADILSSGSNANLVAFSNDQGRLLLQAAPIDENWANYVTTPSLLSAYTSQFFVLGYPGVTFDGLTMAYIVPTTPFVGSGTSAGTGEYESDTYIAEEGMSGGPVYVVPDGVHQYVAASTVGGVADTTGEFTQSFVRAIDKSAGKFLADGEYESGLISQVTVSGPTTVARGHTYTYTTTVVFKVPSATTGGTMTTDRYSELKLKSSTPGTKTAPLVSSLKTSNTTFSVTFSSAIRSGSTTVLQVFYDKTATPLGTSSLQVKIQ